MKRPLVFAHRGAREIAPENTLPAFQAALDMAVDGIELDVHCTSDGALVVIHDFAVDATTDGSGLVAEKTLAEIRTLDAGAYFLPSFTGTRIPTLDEVFDLVGDRCIVNVEIKTNDHDGGDQAEPLVRLLQRRNRADQILVSSFNPMALLKMRALDPNVQIGVLHMPTLPIFLRRAWSSDLVRPAAFHPHFKGVDQGYMEWAKTVDVKVNTWTVNRVADAEHMAAFGVDTIMTDAPDRIFAALDAGR